MCTSLAVECLGAPGRAKFCAAREKLIKRSQGCGTRIGAPGAPRRPSMNIRLRSEPGDRIPLHVAEL
ncbi:unnamed protein product [Gadus morhua 'NCC']